MSDFFVKAIVDELADAGFPLSAQQVDALITSRKKATAKAREEIRNAVRARFVAEGLSTADIQRAAKELTQEVVNNTLAERKVREMVDKTVDKAVKEAIAQVAATFPSGSSISAAVKGAIEKEAARLAQQYVHTNIKVTANDAAHYEQGGSF